MPKPAPRDRTNFRQPKGKFAFLTEGYITENYVQLTPYQSRKLRAKLPRSIYWLQLEKGGLVQWCWVLLHSYLTHGLESPITQALVEEYIATLPQAA